MAAIKSLWEGEDENEMCPKLSFTHRIYGFLACLILGVLCGILGWISIFNKNYVQFGIFITFSNISALGGTFFLAGPMKQFNKMKDETRWIASLIYVVMLILTLVAAFAIKVAWLVILCCILQYFALVWYGLSYIPYARTVVKNCCKGAVGA